MDRLSRVHRSPVLWWGLPILALALFYASDADTYPVSEFGGDTYHFAQYALLGASGPLGGLAAWQAGRLRLGGVWRSAPVRHRHRIAWAALRPVLLLTAAIDLLVFAYTSTHFGALPRLSDLGGVALMVTVQLAVLIVGFGLGCALPRAAAVPLAVVGLTLWLILPPSFDDPSYRYLTGLLSDRPTPLDDPAPEVLLAPLLVALAAVGAVLLAARPGPQTLRTALAGCCALAGILPAHSLVADAGYDMPTVPRADSAQRCAGQAPRICVPVEFEDRLPQLRDSARTVLPRLAAAGLQRPDRLAFVSADVELPASAWRLHLESELSAQQLTDRVVTAAVPPYRECRNLPDDAGSPSAGPLTAWLRLTAGAEPKTVERRHSSRTVQRVEAVRKQSRRAQSAWVETQRRGLGSCDPADRAEAMAR
ncbi:hypothetical protein JGS22_004805 [Streptomyces sp. P38-E01]|uniref:DUF7224 domain-containing protein n=1 Tax=Streptomyces tardus TaxID=2780544 RepID=A0A949N0R0_9ACTN|nr:hypothetical protein [Streptomyces tardus]MBU7596975.1 hypothetical protein [Streptomyces tardus]